MGAFSNNPEPGGGINIKVNSDAIELDIKHIEQMLTERPAMRQRLQEAIKKDVWAARNAVVNNLSSVFDNGDPAEARRAVRNVVYEKVLGANLNILNMKKGTANWRVRQKDRKIDANPKMRGGNRIKRKLKSIRMHGYEGKARGMILRWVDQGTDKRTSKYGNRESITARHFFKPTAQAALNVVSQHLAQIIEQEIENAFNQN